MDTTGRLDALTLFPRALVSLTFNLIGIVVGAVWSRTDTAPIGRMVPTGEDGLDEAGATARAPCDPTTVAKSASACSPAPPPPSSAVLRSARVMLRRAAVVASSGNMTEAVSML